MADVAPRLKGLLEQLLGTPLPVRIRAWDGSQAGPPDAPTLVVRNRRALRHRRGRALQLHPRPRHLPRRHRHPRRHPHPRGPSARRPPTLPARRGRPGGGTLPTPRQAVGRRAGTLPVRGRGRPRPLAPPGGLRRVRRQRAPGARRACPTCGSVTRSRTHGRQTASGPAPCEREPGHHCWTDRVTRSGTPAPRCAHRTRTSRSARRSARRQAASAPPRERHPRWPRPRDRCSPR